MSGFTRVLRCFLLPLITLASALDPALGAPGSPPAGCTWYDPGLRAVEWNAADEVWHANVTYPVAAVHPSRAYAGVWLRDSFWTITAIGNVRLSEAALRHFWTAQLPSGQVPTQFTTFLLGPVYRPDESTMLFLIWSAWQAAHGGTRPPRRVVARALAYIEAQAPNGLYRSPAGSYVSWLDSFRLPRADTLSYNQGLFAVALRAAGALGEPVRPALLREAEAGYRALADPRGGYLRFSRSLGYHDISGLAGEYLSLWLFYRPLLGDGMVRRTLATQPAFRGGFRVLADARGDDLSPYAFVVRIPSGDYQNGGSWLLYDYLALAVGALHHLQGMAARMQERLRAEFAPGPTYHEYLNTDPSSPIYGSDAALRDGFSWDTFVTSVDTTLARRCGDAP